MFNSPKNSSMNNLNMGSLVLVLFAIGSTLMLFREAEAVTDSMYYMTTENELQNSSPCSLYSTEENPGKLSCGSICNSLYFCHYFTLPGRVTF